MKKAPRQWFGKLSQALKAYGFKQSYAVYSLFSYICDGVSLHVLVYVDDLIICASSYDIIVSFRAYMSSFFRMKDLSVLKYFLGIELARGSEGLFLSQQIYALHILSEDGM